MAFDTQITDLVGGTIDQTACDQWAADACKEIIHQIPAKLKAKCSTVSTLNNSSTTLDMDGIGDILHVTRLSADSGGYQKVCREIPSQYGGLAEDSTDLNYYATVNDPVFWVDSSSDVSTLKVKPTTTANQTAIVHHISYPTVDVSAVSIIANFPDEAEYLVVLYASIKQLHQYMNSKRSDLPSDLTLPVLESISESLPTWSAPDDFVVPVKPAVPSLSVQTLSAGGVFGSSSVPTYTKPVSASRVAFSSYTTGLSETDPGIFSLSAVTPAVPSVPNYTTPDVALVSIASLPTAPDYTAPKVTGDTQELTATITAGAVGTTGDFTNYMHWFDVLADMIETNEDIEMASIQLNKISTYIQSYQSAMQNQLNEFNEANVAYQASVQKNIQQAQINATEAQQEASLKLQKENQEYASKLQKYQAEVSTYQANVNKEVQEYGQKLQHYSTELNTRYTAWAKTESDNLAQYSADIQNELNEYNKENVSFQANIQEAVQEVQLSDTNEARKLQKYQAEVGTYGAELNANSQIFTNAVTKNRAAFDTSMQKYTSEVGKVSASNASTLQKFQAETADFSAKLQKQSADYTWYQGQHTQLKADYATGLAALKGTQE